MKIVYVITRSDAIGGASVHLLDLACGARDAGHEVSIYVGGNGIFNILAKEKGLLCYSLVHLQREINFLSDIMCFFELKKHISAVKPDLVHLHSSKAGLIGRLVCRSLSVPVVFTAHGWAFTEGVSKWRRKAYTLIERFMAGITDKIIAVSDYDRMLALNAGVGNASLIKTVRNGIPDLSAVESASDTPKRSDANVVRLVMVARFERPKDQLALIESLSTIRHLPWVMEFVGDGPLLSTAKSKVDDLDLVDRVFFPGVCDDVHHRLASADIFILISRWEGLPLTVLEAMRSGLPVIASNVGGVPEAVESGVTGCLVGRCDNCSIVESLVTLLFSVDLRSAMGRAGRLKFEEGFTYQRMLGATLETYEEVVRSRK